VRVPLGCPGYVWWGGWGRLSWVVMSVRGMARVDVGKTNVREGCLEAEAWDAGGGGGQETALHPQSLSKMWVTFGKGGYMRKT
jgi:hypothetical protein